MGRGLRFFGLVAAAFGAAVTATVVAAAQTGDSCNGRFTVAGSSANLTSVFATIDRLFSEPSKEYLRIVLSDAPVTAEAAADDFALQRLTRDRNLHAVVLIIGPDHGVASTQLYDASFKMDSVSAAGTNYVFEPSAWTSTHVSGTAFTREPREFRGVTYEYRATFSAAVHRP